MGNALKQVATFNERFKEAFGERSVTDFAEEVGLAKQTISAYLNGVRKPKRPTAEVIAAKLDVSPAWLCGFDVPMHSKISQTESAEDEALLKEHLDLAKQLSRDEKIKVLEYMKFIKSQSSEGK